MGALVLTPATGAATTLCTDAVRSVDGAPVGPGQLIRDEAPGIIRRDPVGADRIYTEHKACDAGTLSFQATRIYATPAAAAAYAFTGIQAEAVEGSLAYAGTTIFAHCCVTSRRVSLVGCAVIVSYTITG